MPVLCHTTQASCYLILYGCPSMRMNDFRKGIRQYEIWVCPNFTLNPRIDGVASRAGRAALNRGMGGTPGTVEGSRRQSNGANVSDAQRLIRHVTRYALNSTVGN